MKNKKTLFRFYTLFEYEEEEAFLENQHKNGWKAVSYKLPGFYKFEKCEPEEVTYRIDFTNENGANNTEYRQMFADNGWDFLWSVNGFSIFRKPGASDSKSNNEIFTDNASKLQMLQKIQKRRLLPVIIIFLCAVLPNFVKGLYGVFGTSLADNIITAIFGLMFILYAYIFIKSFVKIKKLKEKLQ